MDNLLDKTVRKYTQGKTNKAVEKLLEERQKNMGDGQTLGPILNKTARGEVFTGGACRDPWRSLFDVFTDDQKRAAEEIAIAHKFESGASHTKIMTYGRVAGMSATEYKDFITDLMIIYGIWYKDINARMPMVLQSCLNVFGHGMTFKECQRRNHGIISDKTVKRYCIIGVDEYLEINRRT